MSATALAMVLALWPMAEASHPAAQSLTEACSALVGRSAPTATITSAQVVATGSVTPPGSTNAISNLPTFCRVEGVLMPTSQSRILFEVWMPIERWNGKFAGVGNGGWAGTISYSALGDQLRRGYATASTNTGHEAAPGVNAARFAHEQPEQLIDFAYRSQHETAGTAKALIQAFYGRSPERSYFIGCSSGGYEGLMEAQRFPSDYDGIVAGAPANNWTRLMAGDLDGVMAVLRDPASHLPAPALGLLHRAVIASCDATDGVTDGVLDDPRQCTFDPARLACGGDASPDRCLTAAQVEAARRVYRGLTDPRTGTQLFPGLARGSEPYWPHRDPASPFPIPIAHYKWLVFANAEWDWKTFDFRDPDDFKAHLEAETRLAPIMNATAPDLGAFRQRGGKLLQYHGWNDQLIAPENSIDYYGSVRTHFGRDEDVTAFYRLFMAPGMAHCGGGTGPTAFDMQAALEQWVEHGVAPDRIVATRAVNGVVDRLRPLCPYPQVAVYAGRGDTNDAASFVCREPVPATTGRTP
ncbi:tannase/feruloyl esterase family alpha/beta hydrolase [Luteitalea pratensis]|nr:tannase/feruloyl esterase family alpha/beta hydrolase [Luteitalea pratensis]